MSWFKDKRIALVSVHGDPTAEIGKEEAGGQNVYVRQVGEALAARGWQVDMFTRRASDRQEIVVEHDSACRTIRLDAGPQAFVPRDRLLEHLPAFVDAFFAFERSMGYSYPLIHTNYWLSGWVGMALKKQAPVRQVHTYHSLGIVKYRNVDCAPPIAIKRLEIERQCLETANWVVATSPQERDRMISLMSDRGRIDVVPCGTDASRFGKIARATAREKLGIPPHARTIFYVGRFDPRKGIETLIRATALSKFCAGAPSPQGNRGNLHLIVGGGYRPGYADEEEFERLRALARDLGLEAIATFPGRISDENLPLYYAAADVCVVPSHYEPFGLVAIEAMASHTPVIASDVDGLKFTIVPEETGLLCPPKDEAAFAAAIDRILADPDWRDTLGQAGRQRVESLFSWEGVAARLETLYDRLLENVE